MLEVRLIGTFAIQRDGKSVTISSRAAQSLVAYLMLTAGTPHRREKLAGMFWPDVTDEKARTYLRHELWLIRKALSSKSKIEYLITDDITISFNASAEYWLDVATLKNADETTSLDELMKGLSLFHGELLPGFYDDWITQEREHLQSVYEQKIAWLLEALEKEKRWSDILEWAERWISLGQGPEAAYRYLMVAYDELDDRAKVTATYQRCVQALREFDLEPSEQTRALALKPSFKLNIPIPLTSFIGRETEIKEVVALFSKSRLVTLTGSGGVGKTRLAIHAIAEILELFPDGIWFIDFAPLSNPVLVPHVIFTALGLMEQPERSHALILTDFLRDRQALLVLDNCEHLIQSCAQLAETLLQACPDLYILATSREVLRIAGEVPYRVPSLEVPNLNIETYLDLVAKIESVKLFVDRAAIASPGFSLSLRNSLAIAQICQRLDGIPLAIELAAAHINMLTAEEIVTRLDDRFNLLKGVLRTALPRHQTLRATIEWSYNLLSEREQLLFRRLAVFMGGWTLEAAEEVCSGDGIEFQDVLDLLSQLVNKSLVIPESSNIETRYLTVTSRRYRWLETVRQYAREKLGESGECEQARTRHLDYFCRLAQRAEPEYYGAAQLEWSQKLEDEHENTRAALEWSLQGDSRAGQQLTAAIWQYWGLSGHLGEGYEWLERMLEVTPDDQTLIRAKLLCGQGLFAEAVGHYEATRKSLDESLVLFRKLGDEINTALLLCTLGRTSYRQSDYEQNIKLATEGLNIFRRIGNKWGIRQALGALGFNSAMQGDFEQARKFLEESLSIAREIGDIQGIAGDVQGMAQILANSPTTAIQAMEMYEEALKFAKLTKNKPAIAGALAEMAHLVSYSGDYQRARLLLEEAMEICRKMGDRWSIARALRYLAWTERLEGDYLKARSLYFECLQLSSQLKQYDIITSTLIHIGSLMLVQGFPEKFVRLLGAAERAEPEGQKMLLPAFRIETEKFIETARSALGDEAYTTAFEAGRQMSLDEAVAYALKELQ